MKKINGGFMRSVRSNPVEAVEMLLATCILVVGAYTMIPSQWFGLESAYPVYAARFIAGLVMAAPGMILLAVRGQGLKDYLRQTRIRRIGLFAIAVTFIYVSVLRSIAVSWFPPIFLLYLTLGLIAGVCYLRLGARDEHLD